MFTLFLLLGACAPEPLLPPPPLGGSTTVVGTVGGPAPTVVPQPTADTGTTRSTTDTATHDSTDSGDLTGDTATGCVDPLDPNDEPATAVPLPLDTSLRVDDAHPDWFTFTVTPGERHDLTVDPLDVELAVTTADGTALRYPRAWLSLANNSTVEQTFHLQAISDDGTCIDYAVSGTVSGEPLCTDDGVGNDAASASTLERYYGSNTFFGSDPLGTGDEDWYVLDLPAGATPRIDVWGRDEGVTADHADPSDPPVATHDGLYSYDYFTLELPQPATGGSYYLRLANLAGYPACP